MHQSIVLVVAAVYNAPAMERGGDNMGVTAFIR
jgi:hypothetical protein